MRTDSGAGLWRLREADVQQRAWEQRLHCGPAHQHDTDNIFKQINVSIISSHVFVSITDGQTFAADQRGKIYIIVLLLLAQC